jgi:hypothetical protein
MAATSADKPGYVSKMKANFRSPKWWLLVGVAIAASMVIRALSSPPDTLGLELVAFNDAAIKVLKVTNVSAPSVKLLDVSINDGAATCNPFSFDEWKGQEMGMGVQFNLMSHCQIVKATIRTDRGTGNYSFR